MVEFDAIIPDYEMLKIEYISTDKPIMIEESFYVEGLEHSILDRPLILGFMFNDTPTRVQKTYNSKDVVPIYYSLGDPNSTEVGLTKEVQEFDCILVFGNDAQAPRREPTELIYRAKKMKNKFTID